MKRSKVFLKDTTKKKMNKEIRLAPRLPREESAPSKSEKASKSAKIAQKKRGVKKISKRTTPGKVIAESPPAHIHSEGVRWKKTIKKQILTKNKIFRRKATKRVS